MIPFKAKAPVTHFPIATVSIIAINFVIWILCLVYNIASDAYIQREFAFSFSQPIYTVFTALFMHVDIFHLAGNMLMLWVFGAAVEDRFGVGKYIAVYLAAGVIAALLQGVMTASAGRGLGASGCIFGIMAAYWFMYAWSPICIWFFTIFRGAFILEVAAFWVILFYFLMEVWDVLIGGQDGVAHFAHIGGALGGILMCLIYKPKRDAGFVSEIKAFNHGTNDYHLWDIYSLEAVVEKEPENTALVIGFMEKAYVKSKENKIHDFFKALGPNIKLVKPEVVSRYILDFKGDASLFEPSILLRIANDAAVAGRCIEAIGIYNAIHNTHPDAQESHMALYKAAELHWNKFKDSASARNLLYQLQTKYPNSHMMTFAKQLARQMG